MNAMANALIAAGVVTNMTDATEGENHNDAADATQPGDNQQDDLKKTFFRQVTQFGTDEGKGNNAKPSLYLSTCNAAFAGAISDEGDDAELVYTTYSKGRAKAKGIGWVEDKSTPQQVSKVKTMIRLGRMATVNGPDVLVRVGNMIQDKIKAGDKLQKSAGDILLTVARVQLGQPDAELDDDQIEECFAKKEPDAKIEADLLGELLKKADGMRTSDDLPLQEESKTILDDMCEKLATRVKELGGTTSQRKRLEAAIRKEEIAKAKADAARGAVA